jgi:hypothetical protein
MEATMTVRRVAKSLAFAFIVGGSLFSGGSPLALEVQTPDRALQPGPAAPGVPAAASDTASFKDMLKKLDADLVGYETRTRRQLEEQQIGCGELDEAPPKADTAYMSDMVATFNQAMADAQLAAQTNGASGNVKELNMLEELAIRHQKRVTALNESGDDFVNALKFGRVRLDDECLNSRSHAELEEFYLFLDPSVRKSYKQLNGLGPQETLDMPSPAVPDARGAEAPCLHVIACYSVCSAKNWVACLTCISQHSAALLSYYFSSFLPCWNNLQGKPWYIPAAIWRLGCALSLIIQVA